MSEPGSRNSFSDVSIIGIKHVCSNYTSLVRHEKNLYFIRKLLWSMSIIAAGIFTGYIVVDRIQFFISKPVNVNVKRELRADGVDFPSVTICSSQLLGRSFIEKEKDLGARVLETFYEASVLEHCYNLKSQEECNNVSRTVIYNATSSKLMSDLQRRYMEHAAWLPLDVLPFIDVTQRCSFQMRPCNYSSWFETSVTDSGGCVTFNGVAQLSKSEEVRLRPTISGKHGGLRLVLNAHNNDILQISVNLASGFKVVIHNHGEAYFIFDSAILIQPHFRTDVAVRRKEIKFVDKNSACVHKKSLLYSKLRYTQSACVAECMSDVMMRECGCVYIIRFRQGTACVNAIQLACAMHIAYNFKRESAPQYDMCDCPVACHQVYFESRTSTAPLTNLDLVVIGAPDNETLNYTQLLVYMDTADVEVVEQFYSYSFLTLLAEIGGALGLFLGSALFTLLEILDVILVKLMAKSCRHDKRVYVN